MRSGWTAAPICWRCHGVGHFVRECKKNEERFRKAEADRESQRREVMQLKGTVQILTTAVTHLKQALASVIDTDCIMRASESEPESEWTHESESESEDELDAEAEKLMNKARDQEKRTAPQKWEDWTKEHDTDERIKESFRFAREKDEQLREADSIQRKLKEGLPHTQGLAWGDEPMC